MPDLARPRPTLLLLGGTTVLAVVVLALPVPALGLRITAIVVAFHVGMLALGRWAPGWTTAWAVLAPLSVLLVLPDWFLSAELGTLVFPDTGAPFVGTVPVFMAGMWTMALFPLVLLGDAVESRGRPRAALVAVAVAGLALFWAAELLAPVIPLWEPVGVRLVGGVAAYVLPAEVVLAVAGWLLVRDVDSRPRVRTRAGVVLLPFCYLGLLATGYQVLG